MNLQFLKNNKFSRDSLPVAITLIVIITILFAVYLKFFGLPMTRARNSYNEAILLLTVNANVEAKIKLQESLDYWYTPEAAEQISKIN